MTTRTGFIGILTGMIYSLLFYLFFVALRPLYIHLAHSSVDPLIPLLGIFLEGVVLIFGGALAAQKSRSTTPWRCIVLGALAGGIAGSMLFCLGGAAFGVILNLSQTQIEIPDIIVCSTLETYLFLFLNGSLMGAIGGGIFTYRCPNQPDTFDREDPQMAMNVSVTAIPACVFALAVASFLCEKLNAQIKEPAISLLPLTVSLLLLLISQLALTLTVPHETRQAEHRCGLDEVRMLAFVGIAAGPVSALLLLLFFPAAYVHFWIVFALFLSMTLSSLNVFWLIKRILPRRAQLPAPWAGQTQQEALLFGSISNSQAPRLIKLCIGCGLAMVLPLYICVISVLINLNNATSSSKKIIIEQSLAGTGLCAAGIVVLILIYMIYLALGRWFNQKHA